MNAFMIRDYGPDNAAEYNRLILECGVSRVILMHWPDANLRFRDAAWTVNDYHRSIELLLSRNITIQVHLSGLSACHQSSEWAVNNAEGVLDQMDAATGTYRIVDVLSPIIGERVERLLQLCDVSRASGVYFDAAEYAQGVYDTPSTWRAQFRGEMEFLARWRCPVPTVQSSAYSLRWIRDMHTIIGTTDYRLGPTVESEVNRNVDIINGLRADGWQGDVEIGWLRRSGPWTLDDLRLIFDTCRSLGAHWCFQVMPDEISQWTHWHRAMARISATAAGR